MKQNDVEAENQFIMEWEKKLLFHIIFWNWTCVLQTKMMTKIKWDIEIEMIIGGGQICVIYFFGIIYVHVSF